MGEERQHARFNLVTAGGSRSRGVAFGSAPSRRSPRPAEAPHDIVVRLERNRWNGVVEPRIVLRALCETAARARCARSARTARSGRGSAARGRTRPARPRRDPASVGRPARRRLRRGGGRADHERRARAGGGGRRVAPARVARDARGRARRRRPAPWRLGRARRATPGWRSGFDHLVALDPPPGGAADPLLARDRARAPRLGRGRGGVRARGLAQRARAAPRAHRVLPRSARARAGAPRRRRSRRRCAATGAIRARRRSAPALLAVLDELGLVESRSTRPACRVVDGARTELELSPTFRACRERFAADRVADLAPSERAGAARAAPGRRVLSASAGRRPNRL